MPPRTYRQPTAEDRAYIQAHYVPRSIERLARELSLSIHAVTRIVNELGLAPTLRIWTQEECQFLRDHYGVLSYRQIAQALNMTLQQVHNKRLLLKLDYIPTFWTAERLRFLREEGPKLSYSQIATRLGLPKHVVSRMGKQLKIPRPQNPPYSDEEKQFIIDHYATMSVEAIGKHLNRPKSGILHQASRMGVHKTSEEFKQFQLTHASLSDRYIAKHMARQQPELQQKLLEYPELLTIRKQEIILNRLIKHVSK